MIPDNQGVPKNINGITFTEREIDCLSCLVCGRSSKFIASLFSLSTRTVETHIHNIMLKVDCNSRQQLLTFIERAKKSDAFRNHYHASLNKGTFEEKLKSIKQPENQKNNTFIFCLARPIPVTSRKNINLLKTHIEFLDYKVRTTYKEPVPVGKLILKKLDHLSEKNPEVFITINLEDLEKDYYEIAICFFSKLLSQKDLENLLSSLNPLLVETHQKNAVVIPPTDQKNRKKNFFPVYIFLGVFSFGVILCFYGNPDTFHMVLSDPTAPPLSTILTHDAHYILNRNSLLNSIEKKLKTQKGVRAIILQGIGGSGKTTLAREYARKNNKIFSLAIQAETLQSVLNSFRQAAYILATTPAHKTELDWIQKIPNLSDRNNKFFQFVRKRLKDQGEWIIIFDNVESLVGIREFIPDDATLWGKGRIILTTRNATLEYTTHEKTIPIIKIGELTSEEALALFTRILSQHDIVDKTFLEKIKNLIKIIPQFPLDISLAAYFIKNTQLSLDTYAKEMMEQSSSFLAAEENFLQEMGGYKKTRRRIVVNSLKSILNIKPHFSQIALAIFMMNSQFISEEMLYFFGDEVTTNQLIYYLKKFSLIISHSAPESFHSKTFSIHKSTQKIALQYLEKDLQLINQDPTLEKVHNSFIKYCQYVLDETDPNKMRGLLAHLKNFLSHYQGKLTQKTEILYFFLGCLHQHLKDFKTAAAVFQTNIERLSNQKPSLLFAKNLNALGNNSKSLGNYLEAKKSLEESLHVYNQCSEKDDFFYQKLLLDIGKVYRIIGDYRKAQNYIEQSLEVSKKFSSENKNLKITTKILTSLGAVYRFQGKYKEAFYVLRKSLQLHQEILDSNFPGIAWNFTQLGILYSSQGDYKRALFFLEKALRLYRTKFPECKREMAHTLLCLGYVKRKFGRLNSSEKFLDESLDLFTKNFGTDCSESVWLYANLGVTQRAMGKYESAEFFLKKSLDLFSQKFSHFHPEKAWVIAHLAIVKRSMGKPQEALSLLLESRRLYEKAVEESHVTLPWILSEIGRTYMVLEELHQAKFYLEKSYDLFRKNLGKKNIKTTWAGTHLAQVYIELGLCEKAKSLLEEGLKIHSSYFGQYHPRVLHMQKLFVDSREKCKTPVKGEDNTLTHVKCKDLNGEMSEILC